MRLNAYTDRCKDRVDSFFSCLFFPFLPSFCLSFFLKDPELILDCFLNLFFLFAVSIPFPRCHVVFWEFSLLSTGFLWFFYLLPPIYMVCPNLRLIHRPKTQQLWMLYHCWAVTTIIWIDPHQLVTALYRANNAW